MLARPRPNSVWLGHTLTEGDPVLHRAVKSATALLGAVVAFQAVTVTGALAATGNYATTRSAHNLMGSTKLASTEHIGGTIVIAGVAGAKAAVTFVKVIDPARATEQFVTQTAGTRFVGLEFRLVSQGSASSRGPTTYWTSRRKAPIAWATRR